MATITPTTESVLSVLLLELAKGQLSDETIAAVDHIDPNDAPKPLQEVVKFMHGMTTEQPLRYHVTTMLMRILGGELFEAVETREQNAPPVVS